MLTLKPLTAAVLVVLLGLGGSSVAFAKAHDMGVADGTRTDPRILNTARLLNNGGVAGRDVPGVGLFVQSPDGGEPVFLGVAADLDADLTYGRDVVSIQRTLNPPR